MAIVESEELKKPDMLAVLSRTHLYPDLRGFLLPIFEAISNAIDGIEIRFGPDAKSKGQISIRFQDPNSPSDFLVSVTDNGVGLTDENYDSFRTPFSGFKLERKGRGFGRFISFKVFNRVMYSSRFMRGLDDQRRTFRFDLGGKREIVHFDGEPDFMGTGLCVEYNEPLTDWHDLIKKLDQKEVADAIGGHFVPYFLFRWLPKITIQFGSQGPEDLVEHFSSFFDKQHTGVFDCEIDGKIESLDVSLARVSKTKLFKSHCLLFSAADRIVGEPRDLSQKMGATHFQNDKGEKYIVIAVVHGGAFENRLNDARTNINVQPKVIEDIVSSVSTLIQKGEQKQIELIKESQSEDLSAALRENPILRMGLKGRTVRDYVNLKPNSWRAEQFISDLAIERHRASQDLTKQITAAANNKEDYVKKIKELAEKLDQGSKEVLAEYVVHRRNIISLVEAARRYNGDGSRSPEEDIHELVFRRFSDSAEVSYFEHNLWLIDDLLAFMPYITSDRTLHGGGRKKGDKVTDLAFYDDSLVLGDNDGTTITIVEFKKPSRNDYVFGNIKSDPILQVIETLEQATFAGGVTRTDGSHYNFSGVVRRFAFIIADITPTFIKVLRKHDFKNDWNPNVYVRYRDTEQIFIQVFGYETLVENARKRNQAFFSVLFDD